MARAAAAAAATAADALKGAVLTGEDTGTVADTAPAPAPALDAPDPATDVPGPASDAPAPTGEEAGAGVLTAAALASSVACFSSN